MPVSNTSNPNSKGKAKAKVKARVTQLDPNNELNNEINASSSGLTGADGQYSEDEYEDDYDEYNTQNRAQRLRIPLRQAWQSYLLTAVLAFLTILLGLGLVFLIIADSYTAPAIRMLNRFLEGSELEKIHILDNTLILGEPEGLWVDSVERREVGNGGLRINMTVEIRLGVDTDYIMGFQDVDDNWVRLAWMNMGRWGVSTLGTLTTVVDRLTLEGLGNTPLIAVQPTSPIPVTLCPGLRSQIQVQNHPYSSTDRCDLPLSRLSFSLQPSDNATDLLGFFERSWKEGSMKVVGKLSGMIVVGGAPSSGLGLSKPRWWQFSQWRRWIRVSQSGVVTNLELKASPLKFPNMPPLEPGSDLPSITDLVAIESFYVSTFSNPSDVPANLFGDDNNNFNGQQQQQRILSAYNYDNISGFLDSIGYSQNQQDFEENRRTIVILAHASVLHPFGALASLVDFGIAVPPIPFIVSLPLYPDNDGEGRNKSLLSHPSTSIPVVKVFTSPSFNETHVRLPLWGTILPIPLIPDPRANSSSKPAFVIDPGFTKALSSFIRSYLSLEPSPILLKTLFYPSLEVAAVFPPPEQKTDLVRDVRLEGMWIKPGGFFEGFIPTNSVKVTVDKVLTMFGKEEEREIDQDLETSVEDFETSLALEVLASATVHARIVLPKGFDVDLEVTRLWVDALIYDGDVPTEGEEEVTTTDDEDKVELDSLNMVSSTSDPTLPTPFPLPNPLPPRAFARITPKTWLNATSSLTKPEPDDFRKNASLDEEEDGKSIYVTAQAVDVPLQVLPGRQADLRRFVTKVLFSSEPVVAGVKGVVAVAVKIPGLTVQKDLIYQDEDQRDRTRKFARPIFSTTTSHSDPPKPESDPRIEGSELILTDLPFQGSVPIGGSR